MKTKLIISIISLIVLLLGAGSYYYLTKPEEVTITESEAKLEIDKSFTTPTEVEDLSRYEKLSEDEILQVVHEMTHQKVKAEKKWGAEEITQDRVDKLYSIVEKNDFKYKSTLIDILEPWRNGDFSNAVRAHNAIWTIQNGTVGKATRLLTPVEEQIYIEENFR